MKLLVWGGGNCKWDTTIHEDHWICSTCGYNSWGEFPPMDCMEEESKEQLPILRSQYYMDRILKEMNND